MAIQNINVGASANDGNGDPLRSAFIKCNENFDDLDTTKQDTLVSGTNIKTLEGQSLLGSGNIDLTKSDVGLGNVDNTSDANKPVSTATQTALNAKQDTLVSGTNIKTINSASLLGSGNINLVPYTGATNDLNIGTNDLYTNKVFLYDEPNDNYGSIHYTDGNFHIEDSDNHKLFVIEDGFMQIHKTDTIQSNLYTSGLSATRDHYLPNESGTIALISNIPNVDSIPTDGSSNPVSSNGVFDSLTSKQDTLVSGTNIKTINGNTILGNGDLIVGGTTPSLQDVTDIGNSTTNPIQMQGYVPLHSIDNSVILGAVNLPNGNSYGISSEETAIGVYDENQESFETGFYSKRNIFCDNGVETYILEVNDANSSVNFSIVVKSPTVSKKYTINGIVTITWENSTYKYRFINTNANVPDNVDFLNFNLSFEFGGNQFRIKANNQTSNDVYININANIL
jgi:hypothetical protein